MTGTAAWIGLLVAAAAGVSIGRVRTALSFLIAATPIGWVGLVVVVGSLAVIGAAAGASIAANQVAQRNAGSWYDGTMKAVGAQ